MLSLVVTFLVASVIWHLFLKQMPQYVLYDAPSFWTAVVIMLTTGLLLSGLWALLIYPIGLSIIIGAVVGVINETYHALDDVWL